jgi:hypothetical protein
MNSEILRGHNLYPNAVTVILVVVFTTFLTTIHPSNAAQVQERDMHRDSRSMIYTADIPPIDTALPSLLKTASFGLG